MKSILKLAWAFVCSILPGKPTPASTDKIPDGITEADIEHAIVIVNNIRAGLASPLAVILTDLIPTTVDNRIREVLVAELPVMAGILTYAKDQLFHKSMVVVSEADKVAQDAFAHNMAARILMVFGGGKVNWSLAVQAVEYYLKNVFKS
ncbi:hypothetical protein [Mucilaginibacter sp.]|uniref:hypothetical protein n=1 Tax=Mucilaginibacter sp. TaxID=1882438 RepID=UPI00326325DA